MSNNKLFWKITNCVFFKEVVPFFRLYKYLNSINISDTIENAISKYKFYPSILLIIDKIVNQDKFSFKAISSLDMEKQVKLVNLKKATTSDSIPPKILKIVSHALADALHSLFKDMLKTGNFPENLKLADISPVFKKKNPLH